MNAPHIALCLEQTLGHRAHTLNLEREAEARGPRARLVRVDYPESQPLPIPWAVEGSIQALRRVHSGNSRFDATLFHTSTISLGATRTKKPYVVSVDATPIQLDSMGEWYRHRRMPDVLERAKRAWYGRVFRRAHTMVAWSQWAADSLVGDYGVDCGRIVIAHPGASRRFFNIERSEHTVPTILFVGGDFIRKGGNDLVAAFDRLRGRARLILVTGETVAQREGLEVLSGVTPGSAALLDAYRRADIFCLPTRGDCTSVAVEEAMAAGLPVITTPVGSNPGTVTHGQDGLLVRPGCVTELDDALERLIDDAALRRALGAAARETARVHYDADANARRVLDIVEDAA